MALKGTTIESVHIDVTAFKHEDTTVDFHINLSNIYGDPVRADSTHTFTAKVANKSGYLADFPCAIDGTNLLIDSDEFFELAPDDYLMEIWETWTNEDGKKDTAIYPSPSQVLQFTINPNIEDKTGKIIETIDFKTTIENTVKDFLKNHPGAGTGKDIDLSDYYKKSDIERRFATKDSVPAVSLDTNQRTLTINDKTIDIPASVDLSGYAKKDTVPSVVYDAEHRLLTVNGVAVDLPANVDLSNYYTKDEMDGKLSKVATGGTVDLTGYLKVADADKKYATKQEIPDVSGLAKKTDLDDYAKKSAVPVISLDSEARKLTLNGTAIDIPAAVDLSGYATKQELPKITYDQETKSLTINGTKIELPSNVDLSGYYTKSEVDGKLKASSVRHAPTGYTLDRTTNPWTIWFDNGSGIQFPAYGTTVTIYGYNQGVNVYSTLWIAWPLISSILSASHGTLTLDTIAKVNGSADYWDVAKVINPINSDADSYDWSNVYFNDTSRSNSKSLVNNRQKNFLKACYELGIFSVEDLKPFGLVKIV